LQKKDVERLKNENVLAINNNYLIAPWAKVLYFCDEKWFNWHKDRPEFKQFKGKKYSHIVDPRTCRPVPARGGVTVVTASAVWADILSTAAYVDPELSREIKTAQFYLY